MHKSFYLICPTDCLEHTINKKFKYENYFYTSLGNSFVYDRNTIEYISKIIKKHKIREICFVLSIDNKIVSDALNNNTFLNIGALNNFYTEIRQQKKHSEIAFKKENLQFTIISYYLNKRIKELEIQLINLSSQSIKIRGKIYNRNQDKFSTIYSELICIEKCQLS